MMITALYAAILGILLIVLSFLVIRGRFKYEAGIGDKGNEDMHRCIRVQANFTEYVPLALILIVLYEMSGTPMQEVSPQTIHGLGISLVVARILHAYGLTKSAGTTIPRFIGTVGTFLVILGTSGLLIMGYISPTAPAMPAMP